MNKLCVYSGSNYGNKPEYREAAAALGALLAQNNIELIYGGSSVGLMGESAEHALKHNGKVTGIIPKGLFPKEIINYDLVNLIEVADMHERKMTMATLADGFIAMPGGIGTYDELFEILSWAQLKIHKKPVGLLNVAGFFDPLLKMLQATIEEGFINASNLSLLIIDDNPSTLLKKMDDYSPPELGAKWKHLIN